MQKGWDPMKMRKKRERRCRHWRNEKKRVGGRDLGKLSCGSAPKESIEEVTAQHPKNSGPPKEHASEWENPQGRKKKNKRPQGEVVERSGLLSSSCTSPWSNPTKRMVNGLRKVWRN